MKASPSAASFWPAPAKLNLFLHVTGRRADGRHDLQTLFQLLDYCDEITIAVRARGGVDVECDADIPPADNLARRAALLLKDATGTSRGAFVTVAKRIPQGAGLGGGSSDAATVLLALNRLWECGLGCDDLARLGARLGADVPVFVGGRSAWAEGTGERLSPVEPPPRWYAVFVPAVVVSTREMFQAPDLRRDYPRVTLADYRAGATVNAFEELAAARHPEIARGLDWLGGHAPARLTGTGAAFYAAFEREEQAGAVLARRPAGLGGFIARGVAESPLHRRLGEKLGERLGEVGADGL